MALFHASQSLVHGRGAVNEIEGEDQGHHHASLKPQYLVLSCQEQKGTSGKVLIVSASVLGSIASAP